jgi:hypothetical protein
MRKGVVLLTMSRLRSAATALSLFRILLRGYAMLVVHRVRLRFAVALFDTPSCSPLPRSGQAALSTIHKRAVAMNEPGLLNLLVAAGFMKKRFCAQVKI